MRLLIKSLYCFLILSLVINVNAGSLPKIAKIKAAYIFNFPNYTSWPETTFDHNNPFFSICYSGPNNKLIKALKNLTGKIKQKYTINIKAYHPDLEKQCHMLVITGINNDYKQLLKKVSTQAILTVSDLAKFSNHDGNNSGKNSGNNNDGINGHIELIKKANKIRFIINTRAVRNSGLKISSKLLKLAIIVDDEISSHYVSEEIQVNKEIQVDINKGEINSKINLSSHGELF